MNTPTVTTSPSLVSNEPVAVQAALVTAVNATLGLLGFIFKWPQETMALLLGVSGAWISFAAIAIGRSKVTPLAKLNRNL